MHSFGCNYAMATEINDLTKKGTKSERDCDELLSENQTNPSRSLCESFYILCYYARCERIFLFFRQCSFCKCHVEMCSRLLIDSIMFITQ